MATLSETLTEPITGKPGDLSYKDYLDLGVALTSGTITSGAMTAAWVGKHATQVHGWSFVWNLITSVVDDILTGGVELLTKLQAQDNPKFFQLMQAMLEDTLGVSFREGALQSAYRRGGDIAAVKEGGALLLGQLASELGVTLPSPVGPGLRAAESLLGYIIAFSVREANVATFVSLIPEEYRFLDGLRDYNVDLARNLGLGRICRQALMPVLKQWIQDPLTRELNALYFPTKLGASSAIKAHNRGLLSDQEFAQEMAWEGYSERYVAALQKDQLVQLPMADAWELFKVGNYTSEQLQAAYQNASMDPAVSGDWIAAQIQKEIDPWVAALVTDWKTQLAGGFISFSTFADNVSGLSIQPQVAKAIIAATAALYEFPRKRLTLAEMQSAIVEGILTFDDFAVWMRAEGYGQDDQDTLTNMTLLKLGTQAAKVKVAEYTYAKAKANAARKGEPEPPPPPILTEG
jgi:hypothetical protein